MLRILKICHVIPPCNFQNNLFIVEKADQVLPYCLIHLKESLTAKTVAKYLRLSASGLAVNGVTAGPSSNPVGANPVLTGNFRFEKCTS